MASNYGDQRPDARRARTSVLERPASVTQVDFAVAAEKRRLRSQSRQARRGLAEPERQERDRSRCRNVMPLIPRHAVVATYLSREDEPSTLELAAVLWRRGHTVMVPSLSAPGSGSMRPEPRWSRYRGPSWLRAGLNGIPEPVGELLGPDCLADADIIIVAALAAGRDGTRLGAGAGWFDRALDRAREDATILLLCHEFEVHESVPTDVHDRKVSGIVTEAGVLQVG